jgi:ANTAR domain
VAPRLPSFPRSAVVSFDYDVVDDTWTWFPQLPAVDGPPVADASLETFFVDIHDHDRESLRATLAVAVATGRPFACRYRVSRPGAPVASILMVGDATMAEEGQVISLHGYAIDLTDLLETETSAAVEQSARHRAAIEQVKGALMHTYGIDQDEAFDVLRSYSNTLNLKLATLAELVARAMSSAAGRQPGPRAQGGTLLDLLAGAGRRDGVIDGTHDGSHDGLSTRSSFPAVDGAPQPGRADRQPARD